MEISGHIAILSSGWPVINCRIRTNRAMFATIFRIALIICTFIIIVTISRRPSSTHSVNTNIAYRTSISGGTRHGIGGVHTLATVGITVIVGTEVSITTIDCDSGYATSCGTNIAKSTSITIAARSRVRIVHTLSGSFVANIVSTLVVIVTVSGTTGSTFTITAHVKQCARVTIRARSSVVVKLAFSSFRIADVIRANISIATILGFTRHTNSLATYIVYRTSVAIITRRMIIGV
jgi:hypothetical protein